jgi:hypothetical protein
MSGRVVLDSNIIMDFIQWKEALASSLPSLATVGI